LNFKFFIQKIKHMVKNKKITYFFSKSSENSVVESTCPQDGHLLS